MRAVIYFIQMIMVYLRKQGAVRYVKGFLFSVNNMLYSVIIPKLPYFLVFQV